MILITTTCLLRPIHNYHTNLYFKSSSWNCHKLPKCVENLSGIFTDVYLIRYMINENVNINYSIWLAIPRAQFSRFKIKRAAIQAITRERPIIRNASWEEKVDIQSPHNVNITLEHTSVFVKLCNNQCCIQMLTNTLICELHKLIYILLIAQNLS